MGAHSTGSDRRAGFFGKLMTFTGRNIRLYFVDRASVFFSLLGAVIAILIVMLFMKNSIVDDMVASYHGQVTRTTAGHVIDTWLVASACVIASATTGLGAMRQYAGDRESNRWRDFLVSPVSPWTLTLGYILSAVIVSLLMTTIIFALGTVYCITGGASVSTANLAQSWGWLVLCSVAFTALLGFVVSFIRTLAAFTAVSTVVGVVFGFLAETYVHTGALSSGVANVLGSMPFAQASALVRSSYCADAIGKLPAPAQAPTRASMGIDLQVGSHTITNTLIVGVLAGMAVVFTVLASRVIARSVKQL